jgi:hypothetical protein
MDKYTTVLMCKKGFQVGNYKYGEHCLGLSFGEPCVEWFNKTKFSNKFSTLYSTHGS